MLSILYGIGNGSFSETQWCVCICRSSKNFTWKASGHSEHRYWRACVAKWKCISNSDEQIVRHNEHCKLGTENISECCDRTWFLKSVSVSKTSIQAEHRNDFSFVECAIAMWIWMPTFDSNNSLHIPHFHTFCAWNSNKCFCNASVLSNDLLQPNVQLYSVVLIRKWDEKWNSYSFWLINVMPQWKQTKFFKSPRAKWAFKWSRNKSKFGNTALHWLQCNVSMSLTFCVVDISCTFFVCFSNRWWFRVFAYKFIVFSLFELLLSYVRSSRFVSPLSCFDSVDFLLLKSVGRSSCFISLSISCLVFGCCCCCCWSCSLLNLLFLFASWLCVSRSLAEIFCSFFDSSFNFSDSIECAWFSLAFRWYESSQLPTKRRFRCSI